MATLHAGNYLRLDIADSGPGIAPEHLTRIFEPFFTTKESGSGLAWRPFYSVIQKHSWPHHGGIDPRSRDDFPDLASCGPR
jgi:nitrogen-specific signal transduction histidine kinase